MIRKIALLALIAAFFAFLMGCAAPTYQFCCFYDNATQGDPVCYGMNESNEYQTLEVIECNVENLTCTLVEEDSGGNNKVAPICPRVETVPCNTTCAGIFCGSFFYDPRPPSAGFGLDEAHAKPDDDGPTGKEPLEGEPMGLWNAQCVLKNMSPLFLRQVENSDNIVMNKFRFGIGESFQDFEDAQYFFPLTDRACFMNAGGTVDRYTVYALPGTICPWDGGKDAYVCKYAESGIESLQFYDCALRCNLYGQGYPTTIDALNPYLSEGVQGESWEGYGNPFYGDAPLAYYPVEGDGDARTAGAISFHFGCNSGSGDCSEYPYQGTVLYGANFWCSHLTPTNPSGSPMMSLMVYNTQAVSRSGTSGYMVPRFGRDSVAEGDPNSAFNYLIFNQDDNAWYCGRDVFLTQEKDSHAIYPWLLAHHSVYNYQFENGHFLTNGSTAGGAEFECLSGKDCLSGYCNNFDYKRGACVDEYGKDVLCDCKSENGKVVCMGAGTDWKQSWDKGSEDLVELPTSRPALADFWGENHWKWGKSITSIPSIGKVVQMHFTDGTEEQAPMSTFDGPVPLFVLYLGGSTILPDYKTRTWDLSAGGFYQDLYSASDSPAQDSVEKSITGLGIVLYDMNPCMVFPEGQRDPGDSSKSLSFGYNYLNLVSTETDSGTSYSTSATSAVFCCDGTTNCNAGAGSTIVPYGGTVAGHDSPNNAAYLETRFLKNCMEGYESDISVCFNKDPTEGGWDMGNTLLWGWKMGGWSEGYVSSRLTEFNPGPGWGLCHVVGEGVTYVNDGDALDLECYEEDADGCKLQAETYVVIEPRWIEELGRWAFGRCLLDSSGKDLEINEYGVCESCGYLSMAKQEIAPMPSNWAAEYEPGITTYGSHYCPDMEISTPYEDIHEHGVLYNSNEEVDDYYAVEPNGMNGYVTYKLGETYWEGGSDLQMCMYPNGYVAFDDTDLSVTNPQRGLPDILPNAYYVNKKLETMMKRNIQPVIFASNPYLWPFTTISTDTNIAADLYPVMHISGGDPDWGTGELMKDLYSTRDDLFISNPGFMPDGDDSSTGVYSTAGGAFLENAIINEGSAIVVLYLFDKEDNAGTLHYPLSGGTGRTGPDAAAYEMNLRSKATRLLCPNCMTSIAIGYGGFEDVSAGQLSAADRVNEIHKIFWQYDVDPSQVDVIAMNVEIEGSDFCGIEKEEDRFAAILGNLSYIGTETLIEHQKPMVITDFKIYHTPLSSSCWGEEEAGRLMTYLGIHATELSKSGYLGIIYGDWKYVPMGDDNGAEIIGNFYESAERRNMFEGTYVAARKFAGHSAMSYYLEVPEKPVCDCTPCTMADNPGLCNGRYLGVGDECEGYNEGDYLRWPDNCITADVCDIKGAPSQNKEISCDIAYDNGTTENRTFCSDTVYQTPSGFRDVISSITDPASGEHLTWCFNLQEDKFVTYQKSEQHSFESLPSVFSMDGNTSKQCDPAEGLFDAFCGYNPPITKYQLDCEFTGNYCYDEDYDTDEPLE